MDERDVIPVARDPSSRDPVAPESRAPAPRESSRDVEPDRSRDPRLKRAAAVVFSHRRRIAELESLLWELAKGADLAGRDDEAERIRTALDWQQDPEIDWRGIR